MPVRHVARPGRRWGGAGFRLGMGVAAWWLLIAGAVALLLPAPAVAVPRGATRPTAGVTAHVDLPGMVLQRNWFPIPVQRAGFDLAQRAYRENDDAMLEEAFSAYEWIAVTHRQAVFVITVDGEVVRVQLLDGPDAGWRGWLKISQLAP
jgi:hypothetical protein